MTQMKVEPDFPVPDDKAVFSVESEEPVFSVESKEVAGGVMFTDRNAADPYHECNLPKFQNNNVFQYPAEYEADVKRIPEGAMWQCSQCKSVYEAQSKRHVAGRKRYWVKMTFWTFDIKRRWRELQEAL